MIMVNKKHATTEVKKKVQRTQRNSVPQWSQEKYPHSKLTERVII